MEAGALKTRDPAGAFLSLMGDAELRIAQEELQRLWRTSPLNRYFIPISKLPPVGPDPRSDSSSRVPRCYPKASSTSRAGRLLKRWSSMPSTGRPVDRDLADRITAWKELASDGGSSSPSSRQQPSPTGRSRKEAFALQQKPKLMADGKEYPFIPCTCCERISPITRMMRDAGLDR
mmetsp:Transcript_70304/g.164686  ORF Transcript_70304/g.164686 Transcript_70304/m.164686 type:complete len:176 (+) Transcript_70304:68-595(+)